MTEFTHEDVLKGYLQSSRNENVQVSPHTNFPVWHIKHGRDDFLTFKAKDGIWESEYLVISDAERLWIEEALISAVSGPETIQEHMQYKKTNSGQLYGQWKLVSTDEQSGLLVYEKAF